MKGFKCDKSLKRAAFAFAKVAVNTRIKTNFSLKNMANHYKTIKACYAKIKKPKELRDATWDDTTKMIILDSIVALKYIKVICNFH